MPVICPKCHHVRPETATNPQWECPACGICYAKFKERTAEPAQPLARPAREEEVEVKQSWNVGLLAKIVLLIVCGWGINQAIQYHGDSLAEKKIAVIAAQNPDQGVAIANAALKAAPADVAMLRKMSDRLEQSCARNKYGLSESACIARVRAYKDACADSTAQRYPGQISNVDQMQTVTRAYVGCIFET